MSAAAKSCCKRGWITRDEYEEISELYLNENARPYDDSTEKEFLTIEQLRDFKKQAERMNRKRTMDFADMFLFSSFTGLRVSDLLSLKWREVNMEGNMISHKQYKGHNRTPKMLSIPLNPVSKGILDKWKGRYDEFVFGMLPSGYDLGDDVDFKKVKEGKTRTINQSLSMLGDKMRLPFKLHIHCGRHTFSMLALNGGVDIKTTSAILGHASTIVTERVYASLLPNTIAENVGDRLNIEI